MSNKRPLTAEERRMAALMKSVIAKSQGALTQESVGAAVGVTQGQVSHWTDGRLPVPAKRAPALAAALGIDDPARISVAYRDTFGEKPGAADWPEVMGYKVHASLGDGAVPDEYAETHKLKFRAESLRKKRLRPDKLGVVYGRGDSMAPTIENGDAILFDTADTAPRDGQLYVISYDGELFAKRLMELDGMWFAASDNREKHKLVRLDPERGVTIVGRVRWIAGWVE